MTIKKNRWSIFKGTSSVLCCDIAKTLPMTKRAVYWADGQKRERGKSHHQKLRTVQAKVMGCVDV
jgi:hypothetical protein